MQESFANDFSSGASSAFAAFLKEMARSKLVLFAAIFLSLFYLTGIIVAVSNFAGFQITSYSYEEIDYSAVKTGPSWSHWFGTDLIGRDIFTRTLFSIATTVELSLVVVLFGGVFIGVSLGLIAGYYGGWRDEVIMRVGELLSAIPPFVMFLFITVSLRPRYEEFFYSWGELGEWLLKEGLVDLSLIFLVFSLFFWVGSARMIRSQTLVLRNMPYVDAAKTLGTSSLKIISRHILPNVMPLIVLRMFSLLASVVIADLGLSFLGLGIRPPHPSFGSMIAEVSNVRLLQSHPHLLLFPAVVVILFIFSFVWLADNINRVISTPHREKM